MNKIIERKLGSRLYGADTPNEQVAEMIEQGLVELYAANGKSTLLENPYKEWADNLVYYVYSHIVKTVVDLFHFLPYYKNRRYDEIRTSYFYVDEYCFL